MPADPAPVSVHDSPAAPASAPAPAARRRVVVLAGPSGSGKSRLARRLTERHGWPVVRLDDFYRDGDDPRLPVLEMGIVDWDHPDSWHADRAVAALTELVTHGRVRVPQYDISASRATGHATVHAGPDEVILAEGIFAAEIVPALAAQGLLLEAFCVRHNRWLTFWRRLLRDLSERRKPPLVLWRRGLLLCRQEPGVVARQESLGARACSPARAERVLAGHAVGS
ncbi:uridine kinase family protein [Oryzihumus leptocrescens]|uniref:uridine kinase family protein n=1 Tax=Oryzihumus leptocrescens TaxID=297536 RepID=UPI001FEC2D97|nr:AAA family ATPase [Oryzihumus leptocrescens]